MLDTPRALILLTVSVCLVCRGLGTGQQAVIGKACTAASQKSDCTDLLANSICNNASSQAKCICAAGYTGDTCAAVIGMTCNAPAECTAAMKNTICASKNCKCKEGFYGTAGHICNVTATPCNATLSCSASNATCDATAKHCKCDDGYAGSTICTAVIGKACTAASQKSDCTDLLANSICNNASSQSQCICAAGYTGDTCAAVIGMTCNTPAECTAAMKNTICASKNCKCKDGFYGTAGHICNAVIGKECLPGNQKDDCRDLLATSVCNNATSGGKCICAAGYSGAACTGEEKSAGAELAQGAAIIVTLLAVLFRFCF